MARTGMPDDLMRNTMPRKIDGEPADDQATDLDAESRGGLPVRKPRTRGRRIAAGEKVRGRKLQLPDSVFERLSLHAIKRKSNASTIAAELLDRHLPKHRIETDD